MMTVLLLRHVFRCLYICIVNTGAKRIKEILLKNTPEIFLIEKHFSIESLEINEIPFFHVTFFNVTFQFLNQ